MNGSDSLTRLVIMGFKDEEYTEMTRENPFTAQLNPDTFSRTFSFEASTQGTKNKKGVKKGTTRKTGETYSFDLLLDGTGVVGEKGKGDLTAQIDEFLGSIYYTRMEKSKEVIEPAHLKIYYCHQLFKCVISSLTVKYTLFSKDGLPLRATLKCSFASEAEPIINKNESIGKGTYLDSLNEISFDEITKDEEISREEAVDAGGDVEKIIKQAAKKLCDSIYPKNL